MTSVAKLVSERALSDTLDLCCVDIHNFLPLISISLQRQPCAFVFSLLDREQVERFMSNCEQLEYYVNSVFCFSVL
jgi:hypothetical protein